MQDINLAHHPASCRRSANTALAVSRAESLKTREIPYRRRQTRTLPASTWFVIAAVAGVVLVAMAKADETPRRRDILARCEIQTLSRDAMNATAPPGRDVDLHYQRGPDGDWSVPPRADWNDPRVMLLLMTPKEPLVIELSILVDGKAFCHQREAWIDKAMRLGDDDRMKPDAKAPASDDANKKHAGDVPSGTYERAPARERLRRYCDVAGRRVERDEARWLLAQWTPGAPLLLLRPGFAAERATATPVWDFLNQDGDDRLSAGEIAQASQRLLQRDTDQDAMLTIDELRSADGHQQPFRELTAQPPWMLLLLDASTDWKSVGKDIVKYCGAMPSRLAVAGQSGKAPELHPDIVIRVSFGKNDGEPAGVRIEQIDQRLLSGKSPIHSSARAVAIDLPAASLEIAAAEQPIAKDGSCDSDQVSVGAVMDGYPLLRLLDGDGDRRLSQREIHDAGACLNRLDRDGDGAVSRKELPTPIRLVVTRGPCAHRVLQPPEPRAAEDDRRTSDAAPAWFLGADANHDGDLTRDEFLGTDEQFKKLDRNADGWVSRQEAEEYQPKSP